MRKAGKPPRPLSACVTARCRSAVHPTKKKRLDRPDRNGARGRFPEPESPPIAAKDPRVPPDSVRRIQKAKGLQSDRPVSERLGRSQAHSADFATARAVSTGASRGYAVPEVRRHVLEILREMPALQPEGMGFLFNRGMPMILWEEALCRRFRQRHQAEAHEVGEDDPRHAWTRTTSAAGSPTRGFDRP